MIDGCISLFYQNQRSLFIPSGCSSVDEVYRISDSYSSTPVEQFFDNDFRVLQNGPGGCIICPFSGLSPHHLIRGPLVDAHRVSLEEDLPLPSAHFLSDSDATVHRPVGLVELDVLAQKQLDWVGSQFSSVPVFWSYPLEHTTTKSTTC